MFRVLENSKTIYNLHIKGLVSLRGRGGNVVENCREKRSAKCSLRVVQLHVKKFSNRGKHALTIGYLFTRGLNKKMIK